MKAPFSPYLDSIAPALKKIVDALSGSFDYVSVLSSDSVGFTMRIGQKSKSVSEENLTTERGSVIRVCRGGLYSEYAFNTLDAACPERTAEEILSALSAREEMLRTLDVRSYRTPVLEDRPLKLREEFECGILPEEADRGDLVRRFTALSDEGVKAREGVIDCMASLSSTHISKLFMTPNRDLRQSYVYSEGGVALLGAENGKTEFARQSCSGRVGPEIADRITRFLPEAVRVLDDKLRAGSIPPGEYDVVVSPDVAGLIAHEAFGHGVEMDMFVKKRALGAEYIGKRVGSDLVTMHEGALSAVNVASYAFDDEGTPAADTVEIRNGILVTGVCDALSAARLGVSPTGNGKRQNFEHKVYTRMTNTLFDPGHDSREKMISSIRYGFLLDGTESGMEDPKHWGIQCIVERAYEIRDGRLTGRVFSPIVMTGYVPDLLSSVSMAGPEQEVFGTGYCGKGHKEWVKVSDGGPYMKMRARLG